MNRDAVEKIANAVLYEGYMLYPYRPSALKNQQRWNFGTLYPRDYEEVRRGTERAGMHVECLIAGGLETDLDVRVRFLQLGTRHNAEAPSQWDQAMERAVEMRLKPVGAPPPVSFSFPGAGTTITGSVRLTADTLRDNMSKLTIELLNESSLDSCSTRDQALMNSLLSAHMILYAEKREFVSLLDPPDEMRDEVKACKNFGCFPVLVGDPGQHSILLCSPIILYDYPQIAPESAGDFFDSTEMDEMLTLRLLTLTPEEKQAMSESDEHARELLERTEASAREQLARVHGAIRSLRPTSES